MQRHRLARGKSWASKFDGKLPGFLSKIIVYRDAEISTGPLAAELLSETLASARRERRYQAEDFEKKGKWLKPERPMPLQRAVERASAQLT